MIDKTAKHLAKQAKKEAAKALENAGQALSKSKQKANTIAMSKPQEEEQILDLETAIKNKRDLAAMAEKYDPRAVEKYWYQWWKDNKFWSVDAQKALAVPWEKRFTMLLPPPNVTGYLHIGHALMITIEDTLARW